MTDAAPCARAGARGTLLLTASLLLVAEGLTAQTPSDTASLESSGAGRSAAAAEERRPPSAGERFRASSYLPLDHPAYPLLDRWIAAGRIDRLSPLVRPYRRVEVARALEEVRGVASTLPPAEREALARLERSLTEGREEEGEETARLGARLFGGLAYRTQTHRDPLRPALEGEFATDRLLERAGVELRGRGGPVAGGFRLVRDRLYLHDAQYPEGRVVREVNLPLIDEAAMRVEEAYLELQTRYARLSFGRRYQGWGLDWGIPAAGGFLRSPYAYSFEEIGYRVGTDRIFLTGAFASLSDFGSFEVDTARWYAIHRLEVRPADDLVLAVSEASLHGGTDEHLDFTLVNPLSIWILARSDEAQTLSNLVGSVDVWWRARPGLVLEGSLIADATNTPRTGDTCCELGGTLGLELPRLGGGWTAALRIAALQSLVYRTVTPWERYAFEGVGLGWDKSDLYLASLQAEWLATGGLLLRPRLDLQVRGEGDFRRPHPPPDELHAFPRILVGEAETTLRPAVAGRWRPPLDGPLALDVEWDVGLAFIDDWRNEPGVSRAPLVGRVAVTVESPEALFRLR